MNDKKYFTSMLGLNFVHILNSEERISNEVLIHKFKELILGYYDEPFGIVKDLGEDFLCEHSELHEILMVYLLLYTHIALFGEDYEDSELEFYNQGLYYLCKDMNNALDDGYEHGNLNILFTLLILLLKSEYPYGDIAFYRMAQSFLYMGGERGLSAELDAAYAKGEAKDFLWAYLNTLYKDQEFFEKEFLGQLNCSDEDFKDYYKVLDAIKV